MQGSLQKQPQIKVLRVLSVNERLRLREADIDDVVKTVQGVLPQHVDEDIDVTITLLEKNLKIMADMALMKKALTHLVRKAIPDYGKYSLTINQVNFDFESLLHNDVSIIGACALIPFAGVGTYIGIDQKMKKKILEPFFTIETDDNGLGFAMAYRIIKHYEGRIKVESPVRHDEEVNIYLPLTKLEIVNMMSIPVG
jgi:nitrogen fixation/metabolism regulation signal transduction histidine kinase